jgi:hypothetical protein
MKVCPAFLWALVMGSALAGALAGTIFEGVLDKYLMLPAVLERYGLAHLGPADVEEVVSTTIAALLATLVVGLLAFTAYTWFSYKRR